MIIIIFNGMEGKYPGELDWASMRLMQIWRRPPALKSTRLHARERHAYERHAYERTSALHAFLRAYTSKPYESSFSRSLRQISGPLFFLYSSLQPSSVASARRLRVTFTSLSVRVAALLFRLLSPDLDTE
jgi:hypothetical protein